MKKFIKDILRFGLIAVILLIVTSEALPAGVFYYRPWEYLLYGKINASGPFYANQQIKMNSSGDLCHHTANAKMKNELWQTDGFGYRNKKIIKKPDVVIIGDSFIAGASLSQDELLSSRLNQVGLNWKVYNMAPSCPEELLRMITQGFIEKPRLVILCNVERTEISYFSNKEYTNVKFIRFSKNNEYTSFFDRVLKFPMLNYIKNRIQLKNGGGKLGTLKSKMYFIQGTEVKKAEHNIRKNVELLLRYKTLFAKKGIRFIYAPMPNKETVYFDYVPLTSQPNYLPQLISSLNENNVETIDVLGIYNDYRRRNTKLLYHLDDSHWNGNATLLLAKFLKEKILKTEKE